MVHRITWAAVVLGAISTGCVLDREATAANLIAKADGHFEKREYRVAALLYTKATKTDPHSVEAYYKLGLSHSKSGSMRRASQAWRRAVELDPEHPEAFSKLAAVYLSAFRVDPRQRDRALQEFNAVLALVEPYASHDLNRFRALGRLALFQERYEDAIEHLTAAEELDETDPVVRLALIQSLAGADRGEEADELARETIQSMPENAEVYDFLYTSYMTRRLTDDAESVLREKCENLPKVANHWLQLAMHFRLTEQKDKMDEVLEYVLSHSNEFPEGRMSVGIFHHQFKEYDQALDVFEQGAQDQPEMRSEFLKNMVAAHAAKGDRDQAMDLVEELIQSDPGDAQAFAYRGALRPVGPDGEGVDGAITDLRTSLEKEPRNAKARSTLAAMYARKGDMDSAISEYRESLRLRPGSHEARYQLAVAFARKGEFSSAIAEAEQVLQFQPNHVPAHLLRFRIRQRQGEHTLAREELEAFNKRQPGIRAVIHQLAARDLSERKLAAAQARYERLYVEDPSDRRAVVGLAQSYLALNRLVQAERLLANALERSPDDARLRQILGTTLMRAKDYEGAVFEYDLVLNQLPNDAVAHLQAGGANYRAGKNAEAEEHFRRAIELAPDSMVARLQLGALLTEAKREHEAIRCYEAALEVEPNHPVAIARLARLLAEDTAELNRAVRLAEEARRHAPDNRLVADTLALVYLRKQQFSSAASVLETLVARYPKNARWHFLLAEAHSRNGHQELAEAERAKAVELDPSLEGATGIRAITGRR